MYLENVTDEELKAELKRREEEKLNAQKPKRRALEDVQKDIISSKSLDFIHSILYERDELEDDPQLCFEFLLELFYGKEVWKWYNSQE